MRLVPLPRHFQFLVVLFLGTLATIASGQPLAGTSPLTMEGDLAAQMVDGIDRCLDRILAASVTNRSRHWNFDHTSDEGFAQSTEPNRARLRQILGLVDRREEVELVSTAVVRARTPLASHELARGSGYRVLVVSWNVFRGIRGEGLLLQPDQEPIADVVAVPDCDWTPEQLIGLQPGVPVESQFARRLAERGCRVIVPCLIDRSDTHSGLPGVRKLRQSQREVLWRASYQMGRTIQGYEIQKVLAAVDWYAKSQPAGQNSRKIGVFGYGEGGMIAFYAGAVDPRIAVTAVCGYFGPREQLHTEPIYRNVWSLLDQFGDAEIMTLIAPRSLVIEYGSYPQTAYPQPGQKADGAAPGQLAPPDSGAVSAEFERGLSLAGADAPFYQVMNTAGIGGHASTVNRFLMRMLPDRMGLSQPPGPPPQSSAEISDPSIRQLRQYSQILEDTQWLMRESEFARREFWKKAATTNAATFETGTRWYKDYLWDEVIGRLPEATVPPNPRSRLVYETEAFRGYELVLDVFPDVFAFGVILVPKSLKPGERRPVVVCQHGLEGRPRDVADPKVDHPAYHTYACRLADRGFITFAPQNPYIGQNRFRQVLRKAQPLKHTLYGFIVRQHEVILNWLAAQDFVDPKRIAFYGLSYGGKTAMRIPPLLDRYCLSICSADYNEWIWKNVSNRHNYSYLYTGEYDMPEFNLGNTFNYAELSWLIFPRPFMVERGHDDGVAPDEWVAYEFAKTRRHYVKMGLGNRTQIEFFDGPHTINAQGTFDFLHEHLNWPKPK